MRLIFDGCVALMIILSIIAFRIFSFAVIVAIFSVTFLFMTASKYIFNKIQLDDNDEIFDTTYTVILLHKEPHLAAPRRSSLRSVVLHTLVVCAAAVPAAAAPYPDDDPAWEHITENIGILYFYKPTCPYCREQNGILEHLEEKGWKNLVRVDVTQSPQTAADYGVTTVPSLWLIGNIDGEIHQAHISIGLLSEAELLRSIADVYRAWFGPAT
jgi:thiol-disulfide isomerase/thioredoxin